MLPDQYREYRRLPEEILKRREFWGYDFNSSALSDGVICAKFLAIHQKYLQFFRALSLIVSLMVLFMGLQGLFNFLLDTNKEYFVEQ
jgi:hypothetical protein